MFLSGVSSDLGTAVTIAELIIQMIDEEESSDLESIRLASLEIIRGYDPENQLVIDEDQRVEELQRSEETKREVATIESGLTAPITEITALAEVRSKVERLLSLRPKHSVGLAWSRSLSLCRRILELRESIPESIQSEDQLTSFKVELESVTKSIEDDSDYAEQLKGLVNDSITVVETELLRKEVDFALEDTARKLGTGEIVRGHIFTEAFSRISKLISAMKDKVEPAAIKSWSDAQADLNTVLRKGESLEREVKELPQKARTSIPKPQGGPQKALLRLAGDVLERVKDLPVDPKEVAGAAHLFTLLEEFEGRYEAMKKEERHTGFLGAPFISCTAEIVDGLKRKLQL